MRCRSARRRSGRYLRLGGDERRLQAHAVTRARSCGAEILFGGACTARV